MNYPKVDVGERIGNNNNHNKQLKKIRKGDVEEGDKKKLVKKNLFFIRRGRNK